MKNLIIGLVGLALVGCGGNKFSASDSDNSNSNSGNPDLDAGFSPGDSDLFLPVICNRDTNQVTQDFAQIATYKKMDISNVAPHLFLLLSTAEQLYPGDGSVGSVLGGTELPWTIVGETGVSARLSDQTCAAGQATIGVLTWAWTLKD